MKIYEILEKISTATDSAQMQRFVDYARATYPEFDWLMYLNSGDIVIEGLPKNFNPAIKNKEESEFGKSIQWFWKSRSAFEYIMMPSTNPRFNPTKKVTVLKNMINSVPFLEVQALLCAIRGELIVADPAYGPVY